MIAEKYVTRERRDYERTNFKNSSSKKQIESRVDHIDVMLEGPFFYKKGLTIYCPFNEIFNLDECNDGFNTFSLQKKRAYANGIDLITHYLNYFVTRFDTSKELIPAWAYIKALTDADTVYPFELLKRDIFNILLTPRIIANIRRMVSHNYYISLESSSSRNYDASYDSLQITDKHGFIFQCLSVTSKLISPLLTHYYAVEGYGDAKIDLLLRDIMIHAADKFGDEFNIYNKLYITTRSRILGDHGSDLGQWNKCRSDGIDAHRLIDDLTDKIFVETFIKTRFDKNVFKFIHSMLRKWVGNAKTGKFKFNYFGVSRTDGSGDDLSSFDKLEINNVKNDESSKIIANICVDELILKMEKKFNYKVDVNSDEYAYYEHNLVLEDFQKTILRTFYSRYISPYYLNLGYRYDRVIKLVILMKRNLKEKGLYNLAVVCTSQPDKMMSRTLNKKDSSIVMDSAMMKTILESKYNISQSIFTNSSSISRFINNIINNKYRILDYDLLEQTGEEFNTSKELLACDAINFIKMI